MEALDFDFSFVNSNYDRTRTEEKENIYRNYRTVNRQKTRRPGEKYNQDGDSFKNSSSTNTSAWKKRLIAGLLTTTMLGGLFAFAMSKKPVANYPTNGHSIAQIGEFNNINPDVIFAANNMKSTDEVPNKIVLPEKYEAYQEQISSIEKQLAKEDLTDEDRSELSLELGVLKEAQEKQNELADIYVTKENAYIVPKKNITFNELKETLGVPDGIFSKFNNLEHTYVNGEYGGSYKDYSDATAQCNRVYFIPLNSLNKN